MCPESVINPLVPAGLGSTCWWAAGSYFFHLLGVLLGSQPSVPRPWLTHGPPAPPPRSLCPQPEEELKALVFVSLSSSLAKLLLLICLVALSLASAFSLQIKFALLGTQGRPLTQGFLSTVSEDRGQAGVPAGVGEHRESGSSRCSELGIHREEVTGKSCRRCPGVKPERGGQLCCQKRG